MRNKPKRTAKRDLVGEFEKFVGTKPAPACGCKVTGTVNDGLCVNKYHVIVYCALHKAAPMLSEAFTSLIALIEDGSMPTESELKGFKKVLATAEASR